MEEGRSGGLGGANDKEGQKVIERCIRRMWERLNKIYVTVNKKRE
jgi:hypothetical protein